MDESIASRNSSYPKGSSPESNRGLSPVRRTCMPLHYRTWCLRGYVCGYIVQGTTSQKQPNSNNPTQLVSVKVRKTNMSQSKSIGLSSSKSIGLSSSKTIGLSSSRFVKVFSIISAKNGPFSKFNPSKSNY